MVVSRRVCGKRRAGFKCSAGNRYSIKEMSDEETLGYAR